MILSYWLEGRGTRRAFARRPARRVPSRLRAKGRAPFLALINYSKPHFISGDRPKSPLSRRLACLLRCLARFLETSPGDAPLVLRTWLRKTRRSIGDPLSNPQHRPEALQRVFSRQVAGADLEGDFFGK